jgi:hypothetical protein
LDLKLSFKHNICVFYLYMWCTYIITCMYVTYTHMQIDMEIVMTYVYCLLTFTHPYIS